MSADNKLADAERRRTAKFQEIGQLIRATLGSDVDVDSEAHNAIEQWEETAEMAVKPIEPTTPLQRLLREYHDICEEILNIYDDRNAGISKTCGP